VKKAKNTVTGTKGFEHIVTIVLDAGEEAFKAGSNMVPFVAAGSEVTFKIGATETVEVDRDGEIVDSAITVDEAYIVENGIESTVEVWETLTEAVKDLLIDLTADYTEANFSVDDYDYPCVEDPYDREPAMDKWEYDLLRDEAMDAIGDFE
jgi:hypothetical protein